MSVLIRNMMFPSSCADCDCYNTDGVNYYCVLLDKDVDDSGKRDGDCPLVKVEEKTMLNGSVFFEKRNCYQT